jgi:hypothetical protein
MLDDVSLLEIESAHLERIESSGGLVFANASYSGRLFEDQEYNDGVNRGFVEFFLRSGATGFIGVAGDVQTRQASMVASYLMQRFREDPDCPVAEILRDYRRTVAVMDLSSTDLAAEKSALPFIYACMYLFFGGPETTVGLPGRELRARLE